MNKKQAFTLAELLIVMATSGVIIAIGYNTFKTFDKGIKYLYSNVYHSMDRAFYNAVNFTNKKDPFARADSPSETKVANTVDPLSEAGTNIDNVRAKRVCLMLTEYIDTKSESCDSGVTATPNGPSGAPSFTAINGVRYYISKIFPEEPAEMDNEHRFFLVFADLNGEQKPNSLYYNPNGPNNKTIDPDIFAFAVLDIGRVCPLGPPEVDTRYMQTRISYHDYSGDENSTNITLKFSTVSKPYYISKAEAWGYYLTGETDDDYPLNDTIIKADENPYMYNGYIKDILENIDGGKYANNPIYYFLKDPSVTRFKEETAGFGFPRADRDEKGNPNGIHLMSGEIKKNSAYDGEFKCHAGSDEECDVIIEKYVW